MEVFGPYEIGKGGTFLHVCRIDGKVNRSAVHSYPHLPYATLSCAVVSFLTPLTTMPRSLAPP